MSETLVQMPGRGRIRHAMEHLRKQIVRGERSVGSPLPSQQEMASLYRISPGSAQSVLTKLADEGLVKRVPGSGSFVAERLPHLTTSALHFVRQRRAPGERERLGDLEILEELSVEAAEAGYQGVLHHLSHEELSHPAAVADRFLGARGVFLRGNLAGLAWTLHQRGIPVVLSYTAHVLPSDHPLTPFPQINYNPSATVAMAADHLFDLGCRRIAYIGRSNWPIHLAGFIESIHRHDLFVPNSWIVQLQDLELTAWLRELSKDGDHPEALCCGTDYVGRLVVQRLLEYGWRVPEDIRVIAADEGPHALYSPVPLSTCGSGSAQLVRLALQVLLETQPGFDPAKTELKPTLVLKSQLTVRQSCGAAPTAEALEKPSLAQKEIPAGI